MKYYLSGSTLLIFITLLIWGCYANEMIKTKPTKILPERDYFEKVFVYLEDDEIPETHKPFMEFLGKVTVQNISESSCYDNAKEECRKLGGNFLKVTAFRTDPWLGFDHRLEAEVYNLNWGPGKIFVGQIVQSGLNESNLKTRLSGRTTQPYEGIYQSITADNNYKFKVGFYQESDGRYFMTYLSGITYSRSWKEGDVIGVFDTAAYQGVFLGDWVTLDKYSTPAELTFNNSGSFTVSYLPWKSWSKLESTYIKTFPKGTNEIGSGATSSTGTGFLISTKGYVVTCHHVVNGGKKIYVIDNNRSKTRLTASVAISDANNDICILKVNGLSLGYGSSLPYGFDDALNKTGESVFCMGYPLTQVMGNEIKVTNGIISSVTGYKGDVSSYQFSAPAQPGNSGGPLFNSSGNVIGVVNAKIAQAENVSYAVKTSYLNNLIGLLSEDVRISKVNQSSSSLSSMVEKFKPAVYIIEVEK